MKYRAFVLPAVGMVAVLVGLLVFGNLNDNLVYYMTPQEALDARPDFDEERRFRLAGFVAPGSVESDAAGVRFRALEENGSAAVTVVHTKAPPQLFQENIQVVVEGAWEGEVFVSDTMLVKHDEQYRVPDDGNYLDGEAAG